MGARRRQEIPRFCIFGAPPGPRSPLKQPPTCGKPKTGANFRSGWRLRGALVNGGGRYARSMLRMRPWRFDDRCLCRAEDSAKGWRLRNSFMLQSFHRQWHPYLYSRKWRAVHCAQSKFETTMSSDEDNSSWKKLCRVRTVHDQNARDTSISLLF